MGLLRMRQVAAKLNIGYGSALELIHTEQLPLVKIPGRRSFLVDEADVDALIRRFKVGTVPGTDDQIPALHAEENAAPEKRCRTRKINTSAAAKYEWMERYASKGK